MSGPPIPIVLQRMDMRQPWGFRIQGGRDFRMQLQVKKVQAGSPAFGQVHPGDAILGIGSNDAKQLTHMQAHQLIKSAGNTLQLTLMKGHFSSLDHLVPKGGVKFSPWKH
ncbi:hypothetical protein ScPMuIL_015824 [Solemya velum]